MSHRAACYVRVAAESQAELALQEAQLRQYAKEMGYKLVQVECDTGSGLQKDRPGLQRIMAAAEAGEFDVLLTRNPSRLFRDMRLFLDCYQHLCRDCGVNVIFVRYAVSQEGGEA